MKHDSLSAVRPAGPLRLLALTLAILAALTGAATAQGLSGLGAAPMSAEDAFRLEVTDNADGSRSLRWEIADGYYMYRDYMAAKTEAGAAIALATPEGERKEDPTFGVVEVYHDSARAEMPPVAGPVELTYQGCQEAGICYPPVTRQLAALDPALGPAPDANADAVAPAAEAPATAPRAPGLQLAQDEGLLEGLQARGGAWLVLGGFFAFGLLLAFTPCMFPMYPILAGLLSRQGEALSARRGLALSGTYVLAMSAAFGLLGIAAAWSGQNLQILLQSPAAIYVVAAIFTVLALSSFGLFEMRLPAGWTTRLSAVGGAGRRGSFGGAAALGFTSALIMGPCVTAPLAGALLYIAGTGDVALGAAALFALGLGQGVPLLVAGTLGSRILPRAGAWMEGVRRLFGFLFLAMAVWLLGRVLAGPEILALWALLLIGAGVFAGAMDLLPPEAGAGPRLAKSAGLAALLAGAILGIGAALGGDDPLRPLAGLSAGSGTGGEGAAQAAARKPVAFTEVTSPARLDAALAAAPGRPALVYVTADWCVTCKVIEREVWEDAGVQAALGDGLAIAADVSDFDDAGQAMLDRLGAVGPPTMIFLDSDRRELPGSRIVGDTAAAPVRAALEAIR